MRKKADLQTLKCFSVELCSKVGRSTKRKSVNVWGYTSGFLPISEDITVYFIANREGEPVYTLDMAFYHSARVVHEIETEPTPENVIKMG